MNENLVMKIKSHDKELFTRAAIDAFCDVVISDKDAELLPGKIIDTKVSLIRKYKNNILVKNSLKYLLHNLSSKHNKNLLLDHKEKIYNKLKRNKEQIFNHIKQKTRNHKQVFVHSINNELLYAVSKLNRLKKYKLFAPKFTKIFTKNQKYLGKNTTYFDDIDLLRAIKNSDFCFFGAEVINKKHIISKTGTNLCIELAKKFHKPTYVCISGMHFDVHNTHSLKNYGNNYEKVRLNSVTSVISETGIHKPKHYMHETLFYNNWLKNKDL